MPPLRPRLSALAALLAVAPAAADAAIVREPTRFLEIRTYEPEGPFVTIPAKTFGMATLILVGGAAAILCTPIDLVRGVSLGGGFGAVAEACGAVVGQPAASITYIVGGAPSWALKRVFWDAPRSLFGDAETAADGGRSGADPARPLAAGAGHRAASRRRV